MRRGTCVRLFGIIVFSLIGSLVTGTPGLCLQNWQNIIIGKAFKIQSGILKEERALLFYLPEDYDTSSDRYPVLYLLDGDAHFHHVTGIVQFQAKQKVIPPMIVVALANTDRTRDFTPFKIERRPTSGEADRFLEFLRREVIPLVDAQYRTQPFQILVGHSLGGLLAVYSLLQGKREQAIKNLERALELNPGDEQAAGRLKQLK
jgi:predicted alpha/beta superfamily hydrolase